MQSMAAMDLTTMSLALSAILFSLGVAGVVIRRNVIILLLCVELMLNAVNLAFVAFSRVHGIDGQIIVFFVMTVAAAEAAVGLALVIAIFRHLETVDMKNFNLLRW
jgi:NADH-quinone oxidoreductase subunit K